MAIRFFELTGERAVSDIEEFCRFKKELTYIGRFARKETSEIIPEPIIQYDGKFYATELSFLSGVSIRPEDDTLTTSFVKLLDTDYVPEKFKPLGDCPIRINVWDVDIDDEEPIVSYAFYSDQLEEAKAMVERNEDVDIYIEGSEVTREKFLEG